MEHWTVDKKKLGNNTEGKYKYFNIYKFNKIPSDDAKNNPIGLINNIGRRYEQLDI